MSHSDLQKRPDTELVPRVMARAMFGLVLAVLALVTWATLTDRPLESTPPPGEIVAQRQILLNGNMSGAATVRDLDGTILADLSPEQGGFISGVWRVIERERTKHGVSIEGPLTLIRRDNGRISILDPSTGWSADLMGFGVDNARAFARLLAL
ncbi:MAG: photosynthetic complex assembly protein PuhC [Arenibacterium sp.]